MNTTKKETTTTKAEEAIERAGADDGLSLPDGFVDLLKEEAVWVKSHNEVDAYEFDDGSAVVIQGGAWDLRDPQCDQYCWAGIGCRCE